MRSSRLVLQKPALLRVLLLASRRLEQRRWYQTLALPLLVHQRQALLQAHQRQALLQEHQRQAQLLLVRQKQAQLQLVLRKQALLQAHRTLEPLWCFQRPAMLLEHQRLQVNQN